MTDRTNYIYRTALDSEGLYLFWPLEDQVTADREAVTVLVKANLVDDALDELARNIAGDPYYEDHIALFVRRLITAFTKHASPKSKAYLYDLIDAQHASQKKED